MTPRLPKRDTSYLSSPYWIEQIKSAIGERVGNAMTREAFATNLLLALRDAVPTGEVAQSRRRVGARIEKAARLAQEAFWDLIEELYAPNLLSIDLEHEAVRAGKMFQGIQPALKPQWNSSGLPDPEWGPAYPRLMVYLDALRAGAERELAKAPPSRRGPQNIVASSIAGCIAFEYRRAFGTLPGKGKRASDKKDTPFHRICGVVEALLADKGYSVISKGSYHPITLSDTARAEGIARARNGGASFVRTQLIRLQRSK